MLTGADEPEGKDMFPSFLLARRRPAAAGRPSAGCGGRTRLMSITSRLLPGVGVASAEVVVVFRLVGVAS
jgi:hypothetical protein